MIRDVLILSIIFISCEAINIGSRIVGGSECSIEKIPFLVSIRKTRNMKHYCGGTLIHKQFVLSAAHCFNNQSHPSETTLMFGLFNADRSKIQSIKADEIFVHEKYNRITRINDIAVIYLEHKVYMSIGNVDLVHLPQRELGEDLYSYCTTDFTVAGWGSNKPWITKKPKYKPNDHLECVDLPYITNEECRYYSIDASNPNIMCTLVPEGGKDSCQGDSGGPLFCGSVQYGIVSYGEGCAVANSPGFYTRVDRYIYFIQKVMKTKSNAPLRFSNLFFWYFSIISCIFELDL